MHNKREKPYVTLNLCSSVLHMVKTWLMLGNDFSLGLKKERKLIGKDGERSGFGNYFVKQ